MPSKQKIKGSNWEREIAKILSDTYQESFVRTIGSGAYIGGSNQYRASQLTTGQANAHRGDVTAPENWDINIECKNYADLPFHQLITNNCPTLDKWIDQLLTVATPTSYNVIFIKITRKGSYILYPFDETYNLSRYIFYRNWVLQDLDTFLELNKDSLKRKARK